MEASLGLAEIVWLVGVLAFIFGLVIGVMAYHFISRSKGGTKLQKRIDILESEIETYQKKVNNHFMTTAQLVNQLTENYREVHRHLASSADELCTNEDIQDQLQDALMSAGGLLSTDDKHRDNSDFIAPPKDYAPKESPESEAEKTPSGASPSG